MVAALRDSGVPKLEIVGENVPKILFDSPFEDKRTVRRNDNQLSKDGPKNLSNDV